MKTLYEIPKLAPWILSAMVLFASVSGCVEADDIGAGNVGLTSVELPPHLLPNLYDPYILLDGGTVFGQQALADTEDGVWNDEQRLALTYCIDKKDNFSSEELSGMLASIDAALGEWEAVAYINFLHLPQYDDNCGFTSHSDGGMDAGALAPFQQWQAETNQEVLFRVALVDPTPGGYAFFPTSHPYGYQVDIGLGGRVDTTFKSLVQHEFGHILSFTHEHARPDGCASGTEVWEDHGIAPISNTMLTPYDPGSVMHYSRSKLDDPLCLNVPMTAPEGLGFWDGWGARLIYGDQFLEGFAHSEAVCAAVTDAQLPSTLTPTNMATLRFQQSHRAHRTTAEIRDVSIDALLVDHGSTAADRTAFETLQTSCTQAGWPGNETLPHMERTSCDLGTAFSEAVEEWGELVAANPGEDQATICAENADRACIPNFSMVQQFPDAFRIFAESMEYFVRYPYPSNSWLHDPQFNDPLGVAMDGIDDGVDALAGGDPSLFSSAMGKIQAGVYMWDRACNQVYACDGDATTNWTHWYGGQPAANPSCVRPSP